ncbi:MAG: hypothetical protein WA667_08665 [Candidatus Nitrosopolaris sp.]
MKGIGKETHILYFGDFDPSGDDMDDQLDKALPYFGLEDIDFQRIAVTEEQKYRNSIFLPCLKVRRLLIR